MPEEHDRTEYPATRRLIDSTRLLPDERLELLTLLGRVLRLDSEGFPELSRVKS